jgi:hypothetical protein
MLLSVRKLVLLEENIYLTLTLSLQVLFERLFHPLRFCPQWLHSILVDISTGVVLKFFWMLVLVILTPLQLKQ